MKYILTGILILVSGNVFAQDGSEIYLFDLNSKNGVVTISNPINITNRKGYDNQPSFDAAHSLIYYASFNESGKSDIKTYQYKTGETKFFTQTNEREYSPTLTPDKQFISCIIQRDNNAQDLGKYPVKGGMPITIIDNLIVGYHAWVDNNRLALYVLGEQSTLHMYNIALKKDTILAKKIRRSLHKIPGTNEISFIEETENKNGMIKKVNPDTYQITDIANIIPNHEDIAWAPDGNIITSDGEKIFLLTPGVDTTWREVVINSGKDFLKAVTRIAISADGKKMAVVVRE